MKDKKCHVLWKSMAFLIILLNIAAWNSAAFCDWYIAHVFPLWVNTYGRLTGLFPFSVGEWLLLAGIILVAAATVLLLPWVTTEILAFVKRKKTAEIL